MTEEEKAMKTFTLLILVLLAGCATALDLSRGNVPCRQDEMEIIEEEGTVGGGLPDSWTVICHGKSYYCAARYGQYSAAAVNCIEAEE